MAALAAAVLMAHLAAPAAATPQRPSIDDLAGAWAFETDPHHATQCVIRGDATATRSGAGLSIAIHARENCPDGDEARAEERCAGSLAGDVLTIRCAVVSATQNYLADQFSLRVLSPSAMSGRLYDADLWNDPVRWRRASGLTS
jgi:hypothetical protein